MSQMKTTNFRRSFIAKLFVSSLFLPAAMLSLIPSTVFAQTSTPAQSPLLTKSGGGVKPNIMMALDDSGSMAFRHMPEDKFAGDTFSYTNPVGGNTVLHDPRDNYQTGVNRRGSLPGNINSQNYVLRALRSPDTNTIYYSPETRYLPWANADGTSRRGNSSVTAAWTDPMSTGGTTIDLTRRIHVINGVINASLIVPGHWYRIASQGNADFRIIGAANNNVDTDFQATGPISGKTGTVKTAFGVSKYNWCYALAGNVSGTGTNAGQGCEAIPAVGGNASAPVAGSHFTHDQGVYFRLQKQTNTVAAGSFVAGNTYTIATLGNTNFKLVGAASNTVGQSFIALGVGIGTGTATITTYKAVDNQANYTSYTINAPAGTTFTKYADRTDCTSLTNACSLSEEQQNFANWFTYYRNRNLMTRGALLASFWKTNDVFRIGWGRINKGSTTVDDVSTSVVETGVRDFSQTTKNDLYTWLQGLPANGGTPLPAALNAVGGYFSRTDKRGPYTDNPALSSNSVASNKTCRRSYAIIATDGYWTSQPTTAGNADNTSETTEISGAGGRKYKYLATSPYKDGASNSLADYAMYYWKRDLQTGMDNMVAPVGDDPSFWQNLTTFTVGLGVRGTLNPAIDLPALVSGSKTWPAACTTCTTANVDDLWHAAVNSRGKYFSAKNPSELANAIKSTLDAAAGGVGTTAGVATASTVLESTNRKYIPSYNAGEWSGDIASRPLDLLGQTLSAVWNAADVWPVNPTKNGGVVTDWNKRNIVTWDIGRSSPAGVKFDWSQLSSSNQSALGSVANTHTDKFVNFLRGDHSEEGVGKPFRTRVTGGGAPFVLGDFVNSNPVFVHKSVDGDYSRISGAGAYYQAFLNQKASRTGVLFVGGNDGMVHAFADTKNAYPNLDGQEVFAFVPRAVYGNLWALTDKSYGTATVPHQFFVDGWQKESDVVTRGPGETSVSWRNYLIGVLGSGGRGVYALDVTNSVTGVGAIGLNEQTVRWELMDNATDPVSGDTDLGYMYSTVETGVLPGGKWVAVFGNGQMSSTGKAVLYVVDLDAAQTNLSTAITKIVVDSSGSNGLGGVAIKRNAAGYIERIYAGDLKGNMWRFDASSAGAVSVWKDSSSVERPLFTAKNASSQVQPISQSPMLFVHPDGGTFVLFGTGKLVTQTDASDTTRQSLYGVWDKESDALARALTRSSLVSRDISKVSTVGGTDYFSLTGSAVDWTTQRGWVSDLKVNSTDDIPGLRTIYAPQAIDSKTALVSTVAPAQSATVCETNTGKGINFIIDVFNGKNTSYKLFNTNGDTVVDDSDLSASGYSTTADGVDSIVYSRARDNDTGTNDGQCPVGYFRVSVQNSSGQMMTCIQRPPPTTSLLRDRVQRRILNPPIR